jgi:hypothetical protein
MKKQNNPRLFTFTLQKNILININQLVMKAYGVQVNALKFCKKKLIECA